MKRNKTVEFAAERTRTPGSRGMGGVAGALVSTGKKKAYQASNAAKQLGTMAGKVAGTKGGKAGMALAGLAAAGGLGMAGMKAIGARKKKTNSLQGRLSSAMKKMGR